MSNIKDKNFIFCMPGRQYSGDFMINLLELLSYISVNGGQFKISQQYSSMVNYARCKCAGADVTKGKNQKPFGGIEYDYMMWIDSDIRFNNETFQKLVDMDKDIASGWYAQPGGSVPTGFYTPVVQTMDDEFFKKHGTYQFLTSEDMSKKESSFTVDYIGFGWVLIKHGVFESIEYPWFAPKLLNIGEDIQDVCSEDVSFCYDVKAAGFDIWVDPTCRVGHEKTLVI
jgi:GT2 family glycosyltransferase